MTPHEFIAKWQKANLSERSACQQHFCDLCDVLGQPKPAEADPEGAWYTFERGVQKTLGGQGWADVWMRGHFGWEYKGKRKNLAAAYGWDPGMSDEELLQKLLALNLARAKAEAKA